MAFYFFISLIFFFPSCILSGPLYINSITPDFTATYLDYVDNLGAGAFLASQNNTFQARVANFRPESQAFFFVIVHVPSNQIVWSANRNCSISQSSKLTFTSHGLVLFNETGQPVWSTPSNLSSITSMQLLESGNLVLVNEFRNWVWESFDYPTDVILAGQRLRAGSFLVSAVDDSDLSEGDYRMVIGDSDAVFKWKGMDYWKLSMDQMASIDTNFGVAYMSLNDTGVYLMGGNGGQIVIRVSLPDLANSSSFRYLKMDHDGVVRVFRFSSVESSRTEFDSPADDCRVPYVCRQLGVCTSGGNSNRHSCVCSAFPANQTVTNGDCVPVESDLALRSACDSNSVTDPGKVEYVSLRADLEYFSNGFTEPVMRNGNLSACQGMCTRNCSCLGVFFSQTSGLCYVISGSLGSLFLKSSSRDDANRLGYVKMVVVADVGENGSDLPILAVVLLPTSGVILIAVVAFLVWQILRRKRLEKAAKRKSKSYSSGDEEEMDYVAIPGLPVRFEYKELAAATEDFKTRIGSGGFGTVYKGTLPDGTDVAVKKITCLGAQGRREFLTEIAVIGKIHHVNLVRLKGFCAHEGQRFLVYEYMNRGSLDRTLFHGEPVLEWKERYEVALGTARGLAYLHSGCENKIIHCDIKPENILLNDKFQVKMSDFGLSKLLSPEQSGFFTTMRGTRGYLAPEWLTSSAISDKTDVYSYGMVLLELIRGKKNSTAQSQTNSSGTDSNRGNVHSPSSWGGSGSRIAYFPLFALQMHEEKRYLDLVDSRLMGRVQMEEAEILVRVALSCLHEDPNFRPTMTNVVGMLEGGMPLCETRIESLNFLRFYGRRFNEASTIGENNEHHEFMHIEQMTRTNSSYTSVSHLSSQEVSGPR